MGYESFDCTVITVLWLKFMYPWYGPVVLGQGKHILIWLDWNLMHPITEYVCNLPNQIPRVFLYSSTTSCSNEFCQRRSQKKSGLQWTTLYYVGSMFCHPLGHFQNKHQGYNCMLNSIVIFNMSTLPGPKWQHIENYKMNLQGNLMVGAYLEVTTCLLQAYLKDIFLVHFLTPQWYSVHPYVANLYATTEQNLLKFGGMDHTD